MPKTKNLWEEGFLLDNNKPQPQNPAKTRRVRIRLKLRANNARQMALLRQRQTLLSNKTHDYRNDKADRSFSTTANTILMDGQKHIHPMANVLACRDTQTSFHGFLKSFESSGITRCSYVQAAEIGWLLTRSCLSFSDI